MPGMNHQVVIQNNIEVSNRMWLPQKVYNILQWKKSHSPRDENWESPYDSGNLPAAPCLSRFIQEFRLFHVTFVVELLRHRLPVGDRNSSGSPKSAVAWLENLAFIEAKDLGEKTHFIAS